MLCAYYFTYVTTFLSGQRLLILQFFECSDQWQSISFRSLHSGHGGLGALAWKLLPWGARHTSPIYQQYPRPSQDEESFFQMGSDWPCQMLSEVAHPLNFIWKLRKLYNFPLIFYWMCLLQYLSFHPFLKISLWNNSCEGLLSTMLNWFGFSFFSFLNMALGHFFLFYFSYLRYENIYDISHITAFFGHN